MTKYTWHKHWRKKSKYHSVKTTLDGKKFDSKKEARWYMYLKSQMERGEIRDFVCQPIIKFPCGITYKPDFKVILKNGDITYIDIKSKFTRKNPVYRIKIKLLKYFYPNVAFREVL